jgi:anti-sigma regulatory factor (Ser/Thr protein kinase)
VDYPPPLPPTTAEGGRGLFLMHALTDRVRHTRDAAGRNCVCLTKKT